MVRIVYVRTICETNTDFVSRDISALPPVKETKTVVKPRQAARPKRPAPALATGWGNFEATIKANDKASFKDRQAQAAAFAASGQEQYTITETFTESKFWSMTLRRDTGSCFRAVLGVGIRFSSSFVVLRV